MSLSFFKKKKKKKKPTVKWFQAFLSNMNNSIYK